MRVFRKAARSPCGSKQVDCGNFTVEGFVQGFGSRIGNGFCSYPLVHLPRICLGVTRTVGRLGGTRIHSRFNGATCSCLGGAERHTNVPTVSTTSIPTKGPLHRTVLHRETVRFNCRRMHCFSLVH